MRCVLDASVIVKWLLRDAESEADTLAALSLMEAVAGGDLEVLQPPHWLAEVAAVMARLSPTSLSTDIADRQRATRLAVEPNEQVFDTCHPVALESAGLHAYH